VLGPLLATYASQYPDVRVIVDLVDRQVSLVEEGYDLALRVGPLDDSQMIVRTLGAPQRLGLFASEAYLEAHGRPRRPRDLEGHRCLVMTGAREPTAWTFSRGQRVTVRPHLAINSFRVLAQLARAGVGIARLPTRYGEDGGLVELLADRAPEGRPLYLVYPSARHVTAALRAMIELLVESFGDRPFAPGP